MENTNQPAALTNTIQPFVFDLDGDRRYRFLMIRAPKMHRLDVMYMDSGSRNVHSLVNGKVVSKSFSDHVSSASGCKAYSEVSSYSFTNPHSNSFVDFNGDCGADLFITSQDSSGNTYFEIWLRTSDSKFCLVDVTKITNPISMVSIGDMNNDGRLDLVYAVLPTDTTQAMSLNIVYNTFASDPANPCTLQNTKMVSPFTSGAYNSAESTSVNVILGLN